MPGLDRHATPARSARAALLERFLAFGTEGMGRADLALIRRSRAFGIVLGVFLPAAGLSAGLVFERWSLFAASLVAVALLMLSLRYGHLGGARAIRIIVHVNLAILLASATWLAVRIGNGSALSVTQPSVLILATCYLLGTRATIGWTAASIGCLAYVMIQAELPPPPDGMPHATRADIFASRAMVLMLICAFSVVERRFSDRASRELEFLARHDSLTGLLNRRALGERLGLTLARCRRHGRGFALLFVDLDGFKRVNDELGHDRGDALIRAIAERIRAMTRETDVASRVGGDEFTIVIEELQDEKDIQIYADRLLTSLTRPLEIDGVEVSLGASIGVACFPHDATNIADLLRAADLAMYDAKAMGGDRVRFYSSLPPDSGKPRATADAIDVGTAGRSQIRGRLRCPSRRPHEP
jgi:diguanylate cyclase (GGDEF)-like protein